MEEIFQKYLQEYGLKGEPSYEIAGGKCVLDNAGTIAIVLNDGRYPKIEEGFSLNSVCTEEINVLHGGLILDVDSQISMLGSGQKYAVTPGHKYSICGKAICLIKISPAWDKNQNKFVQ